MTTFSSFLEVTASCHQWLLPPISSAGCQTMQQHLVYPPPWKIPLSYISAIYFCYAHNSLKKRDMVPSLKYFCLIQQICLNSDSGRAEFRNVGNIPANGKGLEGGCLGKLAVPGNWLGISPNPVVKTHEDWGIVPISIIFGEFLEHHQPLTLYPLPIISLLFKLLRAWLWGWSHRISRQMESLAELQPIPSILNQGGKKATVYSQDTGVPPVPPRKKQAIRYSSDWRIHCHTRHMKLIPTMIFLKETWLPIPFSRLPCRLCAVWSFLPWSLRVPFFTDSIHFWLPHYSSEHDFTKDLDLIISWCLSLKYPEPAFQEAISSIKWAANKSWPLQIISKSEGIFPYIT